MLTRKNKAQPDDKVTPLVVEDESLPVIPFRGEEDHTHKNETHYQPIDIWRLARARLHLSRVAPSAPLSPVHQADRDYLDDFEALRTKLRQDLESGRNKEALTYLNALSVSANDLVRAWMGVVKVEDEEEVRLDRVNRDITDRQVQRAKWSSVWRSFRNMVANFLLGAITFLTVPLEPLEGRLPAQADGGKIISLVVAIFVMIIAWYVTGWWTERLNRGDDSERSEERKKSRLTVAHQKKLAFRMASMQADVAYFDYTGVKRNTYDDWASAMFAQFSAEIIFDSDEMPTVPEASAES